MTAFQGSLLELAPSGPGSDGPGTALAPERRVLTRGAWLDVQPGWLDGADALFERLVGTVPWRAERRPMYERVVDVPRLLSWYGEDATLPDPVLGGVREALNAHYATALGEPFRTAGLCYYRDGRDSVAWHGDTIGRSRTQDTMVAIVSLGSPRTLMLRPRAGGGGVGSGGDGSCGDGGSRDGSGGATLRYSLGHGDLIVMGGSCQRTWEHAIPKTARPVGPRISVQFRPRGVR